MTVASRDAAAEPTPPPRWSSFCGTTEGGWQGAAVAVSPVTGKPESITLDTSARRGVVAVVSYSIDERVPSPDGGVLLARKEVRATNADALAAAAAAEQWEATAPPFALREGGLAIFDGGSYSRGPLSLLGLPPPSSVDDDREALERLLEVDGEGVGVVVAAEKEEEEEEVAAADAAAADDPPSDDEDATLPSSPDFGADDTETVSILESCVAWGGEARLRVTVTLASAVDADTGELSVSPLRIVAHRETWQCLSGSSVDTCVLPASDAGAPTLPSAADPAAAAAALAGDWKTFDVVAHGLMPPPVSDSEIDLLDPDAPSAAYATSCATQSWRLNTRAPPSDGGGAYVLPDPGSGPAAGPAILELTMVDAVSRGADGDADEGMAAAARGVVLSVAWAPRPGAVVAVQREYDSGGDLVEVRSRAAKKG